MPASFLVNQQKIGICLRAFGLAVVLAAGACVGQRSDGGKRIEPVYDPRTGRLQLLKFDSNGNGTIDTWSYMDGSRVVRIEIDKDEDGKIDRWEYYGTDAKLDKVGFSRANDGKPDAWAYYAADGSLARVDVAARDHGAVTRHEYYDKGILARAEEDTDGDGAIDKWETYDGARLASVAFDLSHRGRPDRRLVYGPDGSARAEVDRTGDGHFVAVEAAAATTKAQRHEGRP